MQLQPILLFALAVPATPLLLHPLLHPKVYENRLQTMASATDKPTGPPLLDDVLALDKSISIFSEFTRSVESISARITDKELNSTILAPSNMAMSRLPRKPWEDPASGGEAANSAEKYVGIEGEDRAGRNLRRFVEAHVVCVSPWVEGEGGKVRTLEGKEVWWELVGGVKKLMPDGLEVDHVRDDALNGEVWVLNGVVNYAE